MGLQLRDVKENNDTGMMVQGLKRNIIYLQVE